MTKTLAVELVEPAIKIPLDDGSLILLGRISAIWGQIDLFINQMIENLHGLDQDQRQMLLGEKAIGPRIDLLRKSAKRASTAAITTKILAACDAVRGVQEKRNALAHGFWGWRTDAPDEYEAAVFTKGKEPKVKWSELGELHNAIAEASVVIDEAWSALMGLETKRGRTLFIGSKPPK